MKTKLKMKHNFLNAIKHLVETDPVWLVKSFNTPNGYESAWSIKTCKALLRRHNLLN